MWKFSLVLPFLCLFLWSFSLREETHYLANENHIDKVIEQLTILPTSIDQELDLIEEFFKDNKLGVSVKISNRIRDNNGLIEAFDFKTKFRNQSRFYKRFSVNGNGEFQYKGHTIIYNEGEIIVSEIGPDATSFKISEEMLRFANFNGRIENGDQKEK